MTFVSDEQLINKSLLHLVHLKIWWNIAEKWAMCGKNHLMCYPRLSSDARVTSLKSNPSIKSILSTPFKADNLTLKYIILPKQHIYCTCFWVRTWLKQYECDFQSNENCLLGHIFHVFQMWLTLHRYKKVKMSQKQCKLSQTQPWVCQRFFWCYPSQWWWLSKSS